MNDDTFFEIVNDRDAIAPSSRTMVTLSRAFRKSVSVVLSLEPTITLSPLYYLFSRFQCLKLCMLSVLLRPPCILVFIATTVFTISEPNHWYLGLYTRFKGTLNLSNGDASRAFMPSNCSPSSPAWSSKWNLAYTLHCCHFRPTSLSEASWNLLHVASALLSVDYLSIHCSCL